MLPQSIKGSRARAKGKREYLTDSETKILLDELNDLFETRVEVKNIRNGEHQTLETLINEEALLFAKLLRHELVSARVKLI